MTIIEFSNQLELKLRIKLNSRYSHPIVNEIMMRYDEAVLEILKDMESK